MARKWWLGNPDMITGAIQLSTEDAERAAFIPRNKLTLDEHLARCFLVAASPVMFEALSVLRAAHADHGEIRTSTYGRPVQYAHDPDCHRCILDKAIEAASPTG